MGNTRSFLRTCQFTLALLISLQQSGVVAAEIESAKPAPEKWTSHNFIADELNELDSWGGLVRIEQTSSKLVFDEGESPYQVVKLPAVTTPYILRAELTYPGVRDNGILWSNILLLDSAGNIVRKVVTPKVKDGKLLTLSSRISVEIDPTKVFFLVFYSDKNNLGEVSTVSWARVDGTLYVKTGFSQTGEIQIYLVQATKKCRFSGNITKCQPQ